MGFEEHRRTAEHFFGTTPTPAPQLAGAPVFPDAATVAPTATQPGTPPDLSGLAQHLGLDAYQEVPDNHRGPLTDHQITHSQHALLDKYRFGSLDVVAPGHVGALQPGQMTQSEYETLQSAWLHITNDEGMRLAGAPADQEAFLNMMRTDLAHSSVLRGVISDLGNETDPAHQVDVDLGRSQGLRARGTGFPLAGGVVFDSFATDQVDLDDLDKLDNNFSPTNLTQTEILTHFLAERRAASYIPRDPTDRGARFDRAHGTGMIAQNGVRDEHHQQQVLDQALAANAATGGNDLIATLADHSRRVMPLDASGNLSGPTRLDPAPAPPAPVAPVAPAHPHHHHHHPHHHP